MLHSLKFECVFVENIVIKKCSRTVFNVLICFIACFQKLNMVQYISMPILCNALKSIKFYPNCILIFYRMQSLLATFQYSVNIIESFVLFICSLTQDRCQSAKCSAMQKIRWKYVTFEVNICIIIVNVERERRCIVHITCFYPSNKLNGKQMASIEKFNLLQNARLELRIVCANPFRANI